MKALRTHAVGGPDTLTLDEVDVPAPGKGEVLVDVKACAINFPDTLMIRDLYQFKPERPYAPGGEIAGVVEAVGEGVDGFKVGDKVMAGIGNGGLAEKVVVPAGRMFPVPDGVPFEKAASLLMTYGTTIHGLKDRGHIKQGDTVLVLGAAGGVGLSAVELAKAYGARVVAAVSSEEKGEVARKAGADAVVDAVAGEVGDPGVEGGGAVAMVGPLCPPRPCFGTRATLGTRGRRVPARGPGTKGWERADLPVRLHRVRAHLRAGPELPRGRPDPLPGV